MKVDRLISIINILNNRNRVSAKELAEKFEVSIKTIQRDIDAIDISGIPIVSFKGKNGGYEIMEGYKIDKSVITGEQNALLMNLLKGFYKQYGSDDLKYLINKFENGISDGTGDRLIIDFSPWGNSEDIKALIKTFDQAILESRIIEFEYINLSGIGSKRKIEPNKIILKGLNWYLYGFCRLREEMRLFKVKRMRNIVMLNEYFPRNIHIEYNIQENWQCKMVDLTFKFYKESKYLIDEYFCSYELIEETKEDKVIKVNLPEDDYLVSMIMGLGDKAELLEPQYLRNKMKNIIDNMSKRYEKNSM